MNELFATGRTRCVIVDDETWDAAKAEAEAMTLEYGRRVSISELVRDGLRFRNGLALRLMRRRVKRGIGPTTRR